MHSQGNAHTALDLPVRDCARCPPTRQVDQIVEECLPEVHATLKSVEETDYFNPLHVHVPKWLIPLFSTDLPSHTLFRLWDVLFTEGSHVLLCACVTVRLP